MMMGLVAFTKAQMSGSYAVPATFTSIAAAINSLNAVGVSGPVSIDIAAGYTETAVVGGYTLNAIVGASSTNTITFQKSGAGANPIIYAYAGGTATPGSAAQDGIWRFVGTDYVTINGIDLNDPNTTNPSSMEFGYGFFKADVANGCQFNTIRNCRITLNRANNAAGTAPAVDGSRGIDVVNATTIAHTTALTPTAATGSNSNNKFYSNIIENCNYGIALIGYAAATPFTLADISNDIGGSSSGTGNTIINYGGGGTTAPAAGIRTLAQYSINVSYNSINNNNGSGVNHGADLRGIHLGAGTSAGASITNNTVTLKGGGTTTSLTAIENNSGATAASNSIIITNNLITNCTYSTATSGVFLGIYNSASAAYLSISNNTLSGNSTNATSGNNYPIFNGGAVTTTIDLNNNLINLGTFNATSTSLILRGIFNSGGATTSTLNIGSNTFQSVNYVGTGSGENEMIYHSGTRAAVNINNNNFNSILLRTTGTIYMIYNSNSTTNSSISNNSITGSFANAATGSSSNMYLYYNFGSPGSGTTTISGNNFSNITMVGTGVFYGFYQATSTSQVELLLNNTLSNVTATGSTIYGIHHNYGQTGSAVTNNTITNLVGSSVNGIIAGNTTASNGLTINLNSVSSLTAVAAAGSAVGVYHYSGAATSIYRNKLYDIYAGGATGVVSGIYLNGGTTLNVYNNLIGDLRAPNSGGVSISGLYIGAVTTAYAHYNTVNLSASSSGANFGSTALFVSTTPNVSLRNNIFVNNSSSTGTGKTYAYYRSSTTISTYSANSNNNLFYAGTPSANNLIFFDGTNSVQTLNAFKLLMSTRDGLSVTENPTYVSTSGSNANFLNINTATPTQIESGAVTVSGVTDDYAGTVRNVTTPDIGAWEGTFTPATSCSGTPGTTSIVASIAAVCPSVGFNLTSSTSYTNPGLTYQWLASTTNSSSGFSSISNATLAALSYTDLPATTWYQLAVTCTLSGLGYTSTPAQITLGPPVVNAVSNNSFICNAATANLSLSSPLSGILYQWQTSTTSSVTGYSAITNATLATRTVTGSVIGVNWYQPILTCSNNLSYSTTATPVSIVVGAVPTATAGTSSASMCASGNLTLSAGTDVGTGFYWTGPSGFLSLSQNTVITNVASGNYSLVTSLATCSSAVSTVSITSSGFLFLNTPAVTPATICTGSSAQLKTTDYATAKVNQYNFSSSTGVALVTLSTGSVQVLNSGNDDTPMATPSNIGFTFNYNGVNYTQFTASPDGWVMLGGSIGSNEFTNNIISTANIPKLYPYWDDLATGTNGYVKTQLIGTAPTRTLVIEWFVTIPRATGGAANSTFQALLHEATGGVEFRYGTMGVDASGLSSSGLTGDATTYNSLTFTGPSTSTNTPNNSNATQPASGTSYMFTPPALTYSWTSAASISSSTSAIITSTPSTTSSYSVDLLYQGCTTTKTMVVNVVAPPSITITPTAYSICPSASATLTATGAIGYTWSTGSSAASIIVSPTAALTNYSIVGSNGVCSMTSSVDISIPGNPNVNISGSSGICTGQTATLTASGASTYSWNTGAITNSITDSPTSNTTYTVTGTDGLGCKTTTTQLVTVAASLSISIVGPTSICTGQSATLTGNGGVTYSWSTGATTQTLLVSPTTNTTYNIIGSSGTCSNTAVKSITVNSLPTVTVTGGTSVCVGKSTTLTATGSAATYSWSTGATTSTVSVAPTTNTTYVLTGYSSAGCATSTNIAITTNSLPVITVASTGTGVCLNSSLTLTVTSGVITQTWNITGNPTTNTVLVSPTANTSYTVVGSNPAGCTISAVYPVASYSLPAMSILPNSSTICAQSVASLVASGATGGYTWSASGGTNAAASFTPASTTVYTVTGKNANNCVNTATATVVTNSLPVISISPASPTVCALVPVTYTASGAATYLWNNSVQTATYMAASQNANTYTVVGYSSDGCTTTQTVGLTTNPAPVIAISPSMATVCENSNTSYTASGAVTYTWADNSTASTVVITPTAPVVYTVAGTGTNGCVGVGSVLLLLYPSFSINVNPTTATVCPNTSTVFTASGALSYSWSNGPTTASTSVSPASTSVYTVTGFDANQCPATQTVAVTTRTVPLITVNPASASVCPGGSISYTASGVTSYSWASGPFSPVNTVNPPASGVYTVHGKNQGGCVSMATVAAVVYANPTVSISVSTLTVCTKEPVTFTATGASTYSWAPINETGDVVTNSPANSLTYIVTGTDGNGCTNSASVHITVDKCTGISEHLSLSGVRMFPNPSTGLVNLEFGFEGNKDIIITNSAGALIQKVSSNTAAEVINLSGYAKGIYFVKVQNEGRFVNFKLVIN